MLRYSSDQYITKQLLFVVVLCYLSDKGLKFEAKLLQSLFMLAVSLSVYLASPSLITNKMLKFAYSQFWFVMQAKTMSAREAACLLTQWEVNHYHKVISVHLC